MMVYNAHFLIKKDVKKISDRYSWTNRNRVWHYIVFITGCLLSGISILFLSYKILLACCVLGLLSFMYTLPILPLKIRLRDFGWLKIITLTLVWTIVTSVLPILYWNRYISDYPFEILMRIVFMFVLCAAFDIRDMQVDLESNIYTLPNIIGTKNTKRLMDAGLIAFVVLCFIQHSRYPNPGRFAAELAIAFVTKIVIRYCDTHPSDKNYLGLVDGMMLIYGIVIVLLS